MQIARLFVEVRHALKYNLSRSRRMDENSINLNSTKIYEKVFTPNVKGYDPEEVDTFLDEIIADYVAFEKYYRESRDYIRELEDSLRKERENVRTLTVNNAKLNSRVEGIKEGESINQSNIELIQRIRKLENALYRLGEDPSKM